MMPSPSEAIVTEGSSRVPARRRRLVEGALVLAGLALFAGLLRRLGTAALLAHLHLVGWGLLLIIGQEILAIVANTLGWRAGFPAGSLPPFGRLLGARIAGDAVNYLTPTATLGGELVRVRLVRGETRRLDGATSIAIAKLSQTIAQLAFVVIGVAVLVAVVPLSTGARLGIALATAAMSLAGVAVWVAQRRGMFAPLARLALRYDGRGRFGHLAGALQRLDAEITRVHRAPGRPFLVSASWFFVGWTLGAFEIALMLWLLGVPVTVTRALAIEALSAAIDAALFFVPGKLGTQEGGKVLIFTTMGLDPALGLTVGVLRRIRELAWALTGLVVLAWPGWAPESEPECERPSVR